MKRKTMASVSAVMLGFALGAAAPAVAHAQSPSQETPMPHNCSGTPAQLRAEKQVVLDFLRPGITLREFIALVDPGYIQHNPLVVKAAAEKHISDYEEFKVLFTHAAARGNPGEANVLDGPARPGGRAPHAVIVMAECDLVTAIIGNTRPDPTGSPGTTYEQFGFDTFRVRDGKLIEHWDENEITADSMQALRKLEQ